MKVLVCLSLSTFTACLRLDNHAVTCMCQKCHIIVRLDQRKEREGAEKITVTGGME